jgi:hypothetical protein
MEKEQLLHQTHCLHNSQLPTQFPSVKTSFNGESLVLLAATDIAETMLGESRKFHLQITL